jgi:hypothetical protein
VNGAGGAGVGSHKTGRVGYVVHFMIPFKGEWQTGRKRRGGQ